MTLPQVAIIGATGTGKSDLSLKVAGRLMEQGHSVEIVNADAMQLYRGMDIGTAKLAVEDRRGIPHHLLDILDVSEEASVADYQAAARGAIAEIRSRGATPILVGGSGLYVSSVLFDFKFPGTDADVRASLEAELVELGPGLLFQRLKEADPDAAKAIGPHNARRIVRALEVIAITGEPFGAGLPDENSTHEPTVIIGLSAPRAELVELLDARILGMWRSGLVDEVSSLLPQGLESGVTARRAIGYAQAIDQLKGQLSETDAITQASILTRRFARRQVSWFRRYPNTLWLEHNDPDRVERALALTLPHA